MARFEVTPGSGQGGCSRWMVYLGAGGVMVLMLFLVASTRVVERGLQGVARRACARLQERLPHGLTAAERGRTERNLQLLSERLRRGRVDGRVVGGFLSRASAALDDGRLTVPEVEELNRFLDGRDPVVEGTPVPPPIPTPTASPTPAPAADPASG